jgi:glucose-1-phosphate thymidylyltransferase
MIAVVLAGGYAKRLWPLTLDKSKVLLSVAGKPVIDYVVEKILKVSPPVKKIIVSTNLRFQPQFEGWLEAKGYGNVEFVPDKTMDEHEKIGAVRALSNVASTINEDFLVLAGDNLFVDELDGLIRFFNEKHSPVVALYSDRDRDLGGAKKGATVILDDDKRIVEFVEKPENPKTTLVGACLYAFPSRISKRLREYVELGLPQDEPGRFIEWLHRVEPVYGYMLKDYLWDIGTLESYRAADIFFSHIE